MIITKGLGKDNRLITKGYGFTLVIITGGAPIGWKDPPYIFEPWEEFDRSLIKTKHIKLPHFKDPIFVNCILISNDIKLDDILVMFESLGYKSIKVFNSVEVEIIE